MLLEDMLEAAEKIERYVSGYELESFLEDEKTVDAVVRNFEIIGEAAGRINVEYRLKNNSIEWRRIRGFRNRLIHEYFGIDYHIVWVIIENEIPKLVKSLKEVIEKGN